MRNAFHQIAVANHHVGVVIHHIEAGPVVHRGKMALSGSHAHTHREALSQWAGRDFDPIRVAALRMARRNGTPLSKLLQIVDGDLVSGQVQDGIQHRGGMSIRQNESGRGSTISRSPDCGA